MPNSINDSGILEGTKYRNGPAMLATSEAVTQEVSAPMCSKSIPNSTTESITCRRCGEVKPLDHFHINKSARLGVSSTCKPCAIERTREWRQANPDRARDLNKSAYQANKEEYKRRAADWHAANPDRSRDIKRAYADRTDPERRRVREFSADFKQDRARYLEYLRRNNARNRSVDRETDLTLDEWIYIVNSTDGKCVYCGLNPEKIIVDHIVPTSRGGLTVSGNLAPCCQSCNVSKGSSEVWEWLERRYGRPGVDRLGNFLATITEVTS